MENMVTTTVTHHQPSCRHCATPLNLIVADLGQTPIANDYLDREALTSPEPKYPLCAYVCSSCRLVQLEDFIRPGDVFSPDYAYQSSMSDSWLEHARHYAGLMTKKMDLGSDIHVVEIASNDGYLLQYFKAAGISVTGIEPASYVACIAREQRGIPTLETFFGESEARTLRTSIGPADLMIANNVLAHVPKIDDFVAGFRELLKPDGIATFEFPHLLNLLEFCQFDTIYHEHFSYLSLMSLEPIFALAHLKVFDAEELPTHGGSLRLYVAHNASEFHETSRLKQLRVKEFQAGLDTDAPYLAFSSKVARVKQELLNLLHELKAKGKTIAAYGAPAKGNTLLNYCAIGRELIDFTVDRAPSKQGKYLPGSHIPILSPNAIAERQPDYLLILPWNLKTEITKQFAFIKDWGGHFIVPIPTPAILCGSGNGD